MWSSAKVEALEQLRQRRFPRGRRRRQRARDAAGDVRGRRDRRDPVPARGHRVPSRRQPTPSISLGLDEFGLAGLVDEAEVRRRVALRLARGERRTQPLPVPELRDTAGRRSTSAASPIGRLVLRHDSFVETPWARDEPVSLTPCLPRGAPTEWTVGEARPEGWRCGRGRGAGSRLRVRFLR